MQLRYKRFNSLISYFLYIIFFSSILSIQFGGIRTDVRRLVANNVKKLRERKKLTLEAAAEMTGVSRSMLAQIEKDDVNPTISVLWKIANGFKVSFTSLVEGEGESVTVLHEKDIEPLAEDQGRYLNYPTFTFDESRSFECYRIVIKPGGALRAQPHMAGTEEYITLFSGEVEIAVGSQRHCLHKGDSIRFHADEPHGYRNEGPVDAELNMLIYYG